MEDEDCPFNVTWKHVDMKVDADYEGDKVVRITLLRVRTTQSRP